MLNSIRKLLLNLYKKHLMRIMTNKLGKVTEDDDKIICYVEKNKCKRDKYHYTIPCYGNAVTYNYSDLSKKLNLDKPIYYVINNISFDKNVSIFGYNNCEVTIKNCNFEYGLYVNINGQCTIENPSVKAFLSNLSISADNLIVKNMNIKNELILTEYNLNISLYADNKLSIIDSNIGRKNERINISIIARNNINLINSKIESNKIQCKTKSIQTDENSALITRDKLNLNVDNFNYLIVTSPLIIYNGNTFKNNGQKKVINQKDILLIIKKLEFLEVLKNLRDKCEKVNNDRINEIKNKLDSQPVIKVLKKR